MSKRESASAATRELISVHRRWVIEIGEQLGLTPTQIARQAGLVPSTLTRLVSIEDHPHALSSTTIDKIVRRFGVAPPITPDFAAYRSAVARTIVALHKQAALQAAAAEHVAAAVLDLADWLLKAGDVGGEQFDAVVSFEVERLRARRST